MAQTLTFHKISSILNNVTQNDLIFEITNRANDVFRFGIMNRINDVFRQMHSSNIPYSLSGSKYPSFALCRL